MHARRASATVANRFSQNPNGPFSDAHTERGTNVLRRLSLSNAAFIKVASSLSTPSEIIMLSITFSPSLTQPVGSYHLQALHQIQLLPQHATLLPLQTNLAALQLSAPTAGSRVGPLLLWENVSLKATSMVLIDLAPLLLSPLLGFVAVRIQKKKKSFSRHNCVIPPIIIHSMIPATASWIVLSINTPSKLAGVHILLPWTLYHSIILAVFPHSITTGPCASEIHHMCAHSP